MSAKKVAKVDVRRCPVVVFMRARVSPENLRWRNVAG